MKKIIFLICFAGCLIQAMAQLTVDVNGNVGIGDTLSTYDSPLSVNGSGNNAAIVYARSMDRQF